MTDTMTKNEVLQQMSKQLRRAEMPDSLWIKLLELYMKLSNWVLPLTPSTTRSVKTSTPLDLVLEEERKRREGIQ